MEVCDRLQVPAVLSSEKQSLVSSTQNITTQK